MNKTHIATMGERFFMSKIAIATDSNSGITQAQGRELGIFVMPMPFYINDELFLEDITLSQEQFYQRLEEGADVKTTQPAPGDVLELWDRILKDYDELVYIPMSSGLSSSCETAVMLAQDYGGRVQVVNNQRISVTLRQSALDAQALAAAGRSAAEIKALLEQTKFDSDIYITVDTLKYLKKGGRCTPAAAAIGTVLNLKPVLRIKGEKLDSFAKARGWKAAKKTMLDTARRVMETDFAGCRGPEDLHIAAAFTGTREEAQEWLEELEAAGLNTDEQHRQYHNTLALLCQVVPELADYIDLETDTINGGTEALRANTEAWKQNAMQQAYQDQLTELYSQYSAVLIEAEENSIGLTKAQYSLEAAQQKLSDTYAQMDAL